MNDALPALASAKSKRSLHRAAVVNGNNVTFYGLFVEHFQQYQVLWNGNNGKLNNAVNALGGTANPVDFSTYRRLVSCGTEAQRVAPKTAATQADSGETPRHLSFFAPIRNCATQPHGLSEPIPNA